MDRLAVQLAVLTGKGAVIPVAISTEPALTRVVAEAILETWRARRFDDAALAALQEEEIGRLARLLERFGVASPGPGREGLGAEAALSGD